MVKYDFILFEHTTVINHQHDLEEIARLLIYQGKRVAIAEVYNEKENCKDISIEHYVLKKQNHIQFLTPSNFNIKFLRFAINTYKLWRYNQFLRKVLKELSDLTNNIYVGSLVNLNTYSWVQTAPSNLNIYLWGLRSFWLTQYKTQPFSVEGIFSFFNRNLFSKNTNVRLFVSNEVIRDEYINLGLEASRIIVRPERTANALVKSLNRADGKLRLLTIGSLRADKRIEITLNALRILNDRDVSFTIAGKAGPKYEFVISRATKGLNNIVRINKRLSDNEYHNQIEQCDFLVLCDRQQLSCVTNGTMEDALLKGKPIIAPNYNPYKYVIDKYGIGISYNPESIDSLVLAIQRAKTNGVSYYSDSIQNYQKTLLLEQVSTEFVTQIYSSHEI